ncbi:zinc finger protein-domain-containing protein [Aspergillus aurantiobrunneus]
MFVSTGQHSTHWGLESRIGAGFCGTVWAADAHPESAFKQEDGGRDRSLENDSRMHQHLGNCIEETLGQARDTHPHIHAILHRFPEGYQPCNMIHAQRIPAMNAETRRLLTERYCPQELVKEILNSDTNRDCLIRPYLGRRRISRPSKFKAFSLRNYPLHIDQMVEIGVPEQDVHGYVRTMAEALAVMHWFVLAAPNNRPDKKQETRKTWSNILGDHEMWVLDFDLVRSMSMDEQGVRQAVGAFLKNDPFFPRPGQHPELWSTFRAIFGNEQRMHF